MQTSSAKNSTDNIFDQVVYIGPALEGKGGIAALLSAYKRFWPQFHYLPSNSTQGTAAGLLTLVKTMAKLPVERLRGRRIAHLHYCANKSWTRKHLLARWAKLLGYKVVMHCHSGGFADFCKRKGEAVIGAKLNAFDHVVVLSDYWKQYFTDSLDCRNVTAVPNIVEPLSPSPMPPCDAGHPFTFLFLGSINPNKGISEMIQACSQLHDAPDHGWQLLIGGVGDTDSLRADIERLGLGDRIQLLGWVSGADKERAFARSHALLLPSYFEGLPMCVLEAQALKRGVISTPVGAVPEIVTDGQSGLLVPVKDVSALTRAMQRYIDHPELAARHGDAGHATAERFTPEAVRSMLAELYNKL